MLQFEDVDVRNFNAILRRSLVWRVKARFEDAHIIESAYEDIHMDGIFAKDPDLVEFLTSPPAVAAGLQIQHAFESEFGKQDCVDMIEQYVTWGGDSGLTEATMREACKLPPRDVRAAVSRVAAVINIEELEEEADDREQWLVLRRSLVDFLLIRKKMFATSALLQTMNVRNGPNVAKTALLESLVSRNYVMKFKGSGKATELCVPLLSFKNTLTSIAQHSDRRCDLVLPELYDVEAFATYLHGYSHRFANVQIVAGMWKDLSQSKRKAAGKPTLQEKQFKADMLNKSKAMLEAEKDSDSLLEKLTGQNKKRIKVKSTDVVKSEGRLQEGSGRLVAMECAYRYSGPETIRARKQAAVFAAQRMSRRLQSVVLAHTHDLDIENSLFTLITQLIKRLDIDPGMPSEASEALDLCCTDRQQVCREILSVPYARGKQLLVSSFYGAALPPDLQRVDFLQNLQRAALYCKWVAVAGLPEEYKTLLEDKAKTNPEGSILSYLYTACEDLVLTQWTSFLMDSVKPRHISLHYDGVRVSEVEGMSVEQICRQSEAHIKQATGFEVHIREKKHMLVLEALRSRAASQDPPRYPSGHVLCQAGNCIPHGFACLQVIGDNATELLLDDSSRCNVYMKQRGSRTYRQCAELFAHELDPAILKVEETLPDGKFLLHCENGGLPHCVAVQVRDMETTVWDTDGIFHLRSADLDTALLEGTDAGTCVFFSVEKQNSVWEWEADCFEKLLDLAASGREAEDGEEDASSAEASQASMEAEEREEASSREHSSLKWLDDSGAVVVEDMLLQKFAAEVVEVKDKVSFMAAKSSIRCPLCPFRAFNRRENLQNHLRRHHSRKQQYCCSGTKQLRIALAFHDVDQLRRRSGKNYLRRAAEYLRNAIRPTLSPHHNAIDKHVRLLLDATGPKMVHADYLKAGVTARRVGRLWYTHSFAQHVWQEILLQQGKARSIPVVGVH